MTTTRCRSCSRNHHHHHQQQQQPSSVERTISIKSQSRRKHSFSLCSFLPNRIMGVAVLLLLYSSLLCWQDWVGFMLPTAGLILVFVEATTTTASTITRQKIKSNQVIDDDSTSTTWMVRIVETQHRKSTTKTNDTAAITNNDNTWGDSEWTILAAPKSTTTVEDDDDEDDHMENENPLIILSPSSSLTLSALQQQPNVFYNLPSDQEFIGEWEIDHFITVTTSTNRDSNIPPPTSTTTRHHHHHHHHHKTRKKKDGWKYSIQKNHSDKNPSLLLSTDNHTFPLLQYDTRQRIWMRKVRYKTKTSVQKDVTAKSIWIPSKAVVKKIQKAHQLWTDEFNFKGFGFVLYKSLIARKGNYGMGIRIPITSNLGFWERRSHWPSITCSMAVYYPWLFVCTWNASLRMEFLQWTFQIVNHLVPAMATELFVLVLRGLALAVSALLFPLTRTPLLMTQQQQQSKQTTAALVIPTWKKIWDEGPRYSRTAEERIGISWNWRYTPTSFELRKQIYHQYMPSIAALLLNHGSDQKLDGFLVNWIRRRSAAFGWSITGPVPDPGFIVSMSGALTVSGFYPPSLLPKFSKKRKKKKSTSTTAASHLPPSPPAAVSLVTTKSKPGKTKIIEEESPELSSPTIHKNITNPILSTYSKERYEENPSQQHGIDRTVDKTISIVATKATKVKGGGALSTRKG